MVCNNCEQNDYTSFANVKCFSTHEPLSVAKCKHCDLVFLSPRPDKKLGLAYFENAYSNAKGFESHSYYRDHQQIFSRNQNRFDLIKSLPCPNSKILDFGAGQGHFVKTALDNGWQADGIELSPAAIVAAKENFNIELLDSVNKLQTHDFGVIALWDVIEHLENPKETILELAKHLHKDGFIIVETSNIDSLDYFIQKEKWGYWHVDHFYYYSKKTIEYLFRSIHFQLVSPPASKSAKGSSSFTKYLPLLNPVNFVTALRKKSILQKHKNLAKSSLMTVIAKRTV